MHCQWDYGNYLEGYFMSIKKFKWEIGAVVLVFVVLASMSA